MSYLLIALVVMVALSPLISAMPTRRQRQVADLRQAALVTGLFVKYRQSPLESADEPPRVFYGRRRTREDARVGGGISYRCDQASWNSVKGVWPAPTIELLNTLPAGVSLACEDLEGVGVFWDEQGQVEDVETINGVLKGMLAKRD
jgi:hypothetical protein